MIGIPERLFDRPGRHRLRNRKERGDGIVELDDVDPILRGLA